MMATLSVLTDRDQAALEAIHNLAQLSHCVAQGKIGSGIHSARISVSIKARLLCLGFDVNKKIT